MKTRIFAAAVLLPLFLVIILVLPKVITAILFGVAAALASFELLSQTQLVKHPRMLIYSAVTAFLVSLWSYFGARREFALLGIIAFFGAMFGEMMANHVKLTFDKIAMCLVAALVVPYLLTSLVRVLAMRLGRYYIIVPFLMAFLPDTGAYFAGRAFGKHKKRTWYAKRPMAKIDYICIGVSAVILIAVILIATFINHGRFWNPFI